MYVVCLSVCMCVMYVCMYVCMSVYEYLCCLHQFSYSTRCIFVSMCFGLCSPDLQGCIAAAVMLALLVAAGVIPNEVLWLMGRSLRRCCSHSQHLAARQMLLCLRGSHLHRHGLKIIFIFVYKIEI